MPQEVYIDNNATTHLSEGARKAIADAMAANYGNASSPHRTGERTRRKLAACRDAIAALINAPSDKIVFGSGVTELNNWVLMQPFMGNGGGHILTTEVEHSSVLETCAYLRGKGVEVTEVKPMADGRIDLDDFVAAMRPDTRLACVQWVNNETGVIQPVQQIAEICSSAKVPYLCDTAQAAGKLEIDVNQSGASFATISAHKMHGPSGVAALYVREPSLLTQFMYGGTQEAALRPGTENILGIIGFAEAAAERREHLNTIIDFVGELRDQFETRIMEKLNNVRVNGNTFHRVTNTSNLTFCGLDGAAVVALLDREGIRCSQSSACTSNIPEPSYVLTAMGLSETEAFSSVRFSFSNQNTRSEVDHAANKVIEVVRRLSGHAGFHGTTPNLKVTVNQ